MSKQPSRKLQATNGKLIAIVGETASGKSALALQLAELYGGEIICADSRTVYRDMNIGTAKASDAERSQVRHHMLDIVDPDCEYTAAMFKQAANNIIVDIQKRGHVPFLVGGSGLYIDAVLFDYGFRPAADPGLRTELQQLNIEDLQALIVERGYRMPENNRNKRYLVRTIESKGAVSMRKPLRQNTLVLGLKVDKALLNERIIQRVEYMLELGLENEVKGLLTMYGFDAPGMAAPGYREWREYFEGSKSFGSVREDIIKHTRQLAKRQRTWFRRNNSIHWVENGGDIEDIITTYLNK